MKKLLNSAVEVASEKRMQASKAVMHNAGVSVDQWSKVLFELGCAFIERWIRPLYMQQCLLQNPALGFWDWWIVQFMDDDIELMDHRIGNCHRYIINKRHLLELPELFNQFEYFLQRKNIQEVYEKV